MNRPTKKALVISGLAGLAGCILIVRQWTDNSLPSRQELEQWAAYHRQTP